MALRWLCIVILCTVTVVVSLKIVPLSNDVRNEYTSLDYVPSGAQFLYRPDSPQLNLNNRERRATSQNVISTNFAFTNDQNPYALIYFSGDKSSVIFVLTFTPRYNSSICNFYSISSRLWRSDNYGKSFVQVTFSGISRLSRVFFISPADKKNMIFGDELNRQLYITTDEGITFKPYTVPIDPLSIKPHPTVPDLLMGVSLDKGTPCSDRHGNLYISTDGGKHWTLRVRGVKSYYWEVSAYELSLAVRGSAHNVTFYYLKDDESSNSTDKHTVYRSSVEYGKDTVDYAREFDTSLGKIFSFAVLEQFLWAIKHNSDGSQSLYISYKRKPFKKIVVPVADSHQRYFMYLLEGKQLLLLIQHSTSQSTSGYKYNLYLSDVEGVSYSLALEDVAYNSRGNFDLEYIEGLPGTFIANQYISGLSGNGDNVRTVISFDGGAEWNLVQPPSGVSTPDGSYCIPPLCSLHFHMSASANYTRFGVASWDSIPGVIIAHGTVGRKLSANPDLYISRDGGISWEKTLDGTWGVNVMDYGSVIVAARDYYQRSSSEVKYTCTEGQTWLDYSFSLEPVTVWGVITEPGETTVVSFLYATGRSRVWMSVYLNFTNIFLKTCASEDYYLWEPWNDRTDNELNCQFGETLLIERRKVGVCCFNGGDYSRTVNSTPCACTADDFECDVGYKRSVESGGPCERDYNFDLTVPSCDGSENFVLLSQGYRKIAGDHCVGGDTSELDPIKVPCVSQPSSTTTVNNTGISALGAAFGIVVLILLIAVAALTVLSAFLYWRYKKASSSYQLLSGGGTTYSARQEDPDPTLHFDGDDELLEP